MGYAQPETGLRAIVGARVSVMTGASKVSHTVQREAGERHALNAGWRVIGIFEDLDVSASISPWDRPDLGPWLKDRADEWDAIVFAKVDRAFRSAKDCADVAHWAEQRRKILVFTDDGITLDFRSNADTFATMMSKVFLMLASLFAEMELRRTKNRVQGAHKYLRSRDRWAGGQPPFGYKVVPHPTGGKTLAIDPASAKAVRAAASWLLEGKSLWQIAELLTQHGHPTPAQHVVATQGPNSRSKRRTPPSSHWNQSSVGKILRSPATMGFKCLGRSVKERRVARGEDGLPIRIADPLFTDDEWGRIQAILEERSIKAERSRRAAPMLGIVYCGGCQQRLYRRWSSSPKRTYEYYVCVRRPGHAACKHHSFRTDELRALIDQHVADELSDVPVTLRRFRAGSDHTAELENVTKAMNDIRSEKDLGLYEYQGGEEEYQTRLAALAARRRALEVLPQRPAQWIEEPTGETYAEAYARMDEDQRRSLLLNAGIRVYVSPHSFELHVPRSLKERMQALEIPALAAAS